MSRILPRRLLAQARPILFPEFPQSYRLPAQSIRSFSNTSSRRTEDNATTSPSQEPQTTTPPQSSKAEDVNSASLSPSLNPKAAPRANLMESFGSMLNQNKASRLPRGGSLYNTTFASDGSFLNQTSAEPHVEPHHFHIYSTRHNTHITLTDPKRNPLISVSCGNIGFRHSARKTYDAAFQLASVVMTRMQDRGINSQIKELEVVLRGFGQGREAVTKALLGMEGKNVRHKIIKVADATRLKFGGTRSKKPRRLG